MTHIVKIPENFATAAVPYNIVAGVRNAGVRLLKDEDRIIKCNVTLSCWITVPARPAGVAPGRGGG
jgi:hypothetical protein